MKILLVGGAGYVGSALAPALLQSGHTVEVMDLLWFGNHLPEGIRTIQRDLFTATEEELRGYDQVVFLAGLSNDPMADFSPARNFIENAAAPAYLAYLARRAGLKRYIYGGSCSVYGQAGKKLCSESSPTAPNYPYGISKLQGEYGVLLQQDHGFSVISLRQGTVCGYSPRMRLDLVINTMFASAVATGKITVNNPLIWRPILDIRDAVTAFVQAVEAPPEVNGIFNVASGNFTIGEIGAIVRREVKRWLNLEVELVRKEERQSRNYRVSCEKARAHLGFTPRYSVAETVADLAVNADRFQDLENERYYNVRTFRWREKEEKGSDPFLSDDNS